MPIESAFDEMMNDTVTIQARSTTNQYGQRTWGTAADYVGRVSYQTRLTKDMEGRQRVSSGRVYLHDAYPSIGTDAKLTLPDGTVPIITAIETFTDTAGDHHTTVHFA